MTYRSGNGDTSSLLLGCLVDSTVVHEFTTVLLGQVFCDGSSQCRLSVIDVLLVSSGSYDECSTYTNGSDAAKSAFAFSCIKTGNLLEMRLLPVEFTSSFGSIGPDGR